jgi:Conserved region of Rad21 / Rec8 like protein
MTASQFLNDKIKSVLSFIFLLPRNEESICCRGMAKYLREHFANIEGQNGNISLDNILEGKTRKHCARMFFETLVNTYF